MSEKAKILKASYLGESKNDKGILYDFGLRLEGYEQPFYIAVKDRAAPKLDIGSELEFDIQAGSVKKYTVGKKLTDFTRIKRVYANRMGFGGGGGGYAKDPNQSYNILVTTCCQKAVEYVISRHNTTIEADFEAVFNKLMEVVEPKLK